MVLEIAALDIWTIMVTFVAGSFWMAIIILSTILFVILAFFGRVSIYTTIWYLGLFLLCMMIGYGFILLSILITTIILLGFYFSMKGYLDRGGQ